MTAVAFPTSPGPSDASLRLMRFGGDLTPPLGGAVTRISRLGSRYAVTINFPPMTRTQAAAMIAALLKAETEGVTVVASWPDKAGLALGSPLVNASSSAGATLTTDGFTAGATIPAGTPFSFTADSRVMLHTTTADVTADGSGNAVLPIAPMLRASPANNAALNFATPQIEGFVQGETVDWSIDTALHRGLTITIMEDR